jgi:hypothetical protein
MRMLQQLRTEIASSFEDLDTFPDLLSCPINYSNVDVDAWEEEQQEERGLQEQDMRA